MAVRAELISIGDELLIGQVINTNSSTISKALNAAGIRVERITTVGDEMQRILSAFECAWREHDVVLVTGGLGPTHDDISKDAVAQFFSAPLEFSEEMFDSVRQRFERLGVKRMPESNRSQAMVPRGFVALKNEVGTAPGLLYLHKGKAFAILPGVPHEMQWLLNDALLGHLTSNFASKGLEAIGHRTIITTGIGESALAEKIGDVNTILNGEATLAFLPRSTGVRLRISSIADSRERVDAALDRVAKELQQRVGMHIIGEGEVAIGEAVVKLLIERGETISVAESSTGGLLGAAITEIARSSAVFQGGVITYSNEAKESELGVAVSLMKQHGTVSEEVASAMADGALKKFDTTYALSITGIAGPGGATPTKTVGLMYVGLAERGKATIARKFQFVEDRKINRERSVAAALEMLRRRMTDQEDLYIQ